MYLCLRQRGGRGWMVLIAMRFATMVNAQYGAMLAEPMIGGMNDPRYHLGRGGLLPRDTNGACPSANMHSCLDVNAGSSCCANTNYCYINGTSGTYIAQCCAYGSNCNFTDCDTNHYQCPQTITVSGTATTTSSCCPRSCTSTSQYLCASSLGGACCSFDHGCATGTGGGSCTATTTAPSSTITTCPTNSITCDATLGGGCCGIQSSCTLLQSSNYYCASGTLAAVRTGSNGQTFTTLPSSSSGGLSTGAKAGIGAGIAVGALLLISGLLWFCIAKRRHARAISQTQSQRQSQQGPAGAASAQSASGQNRSKRGSAQAMSQSSASASGAKKGRPSPGVRQMTQSSDYFGPEAGVGPFTEGRESVVYGTTDGSSRMSPGLVSPGGLSVGGGRGAVPAQPQSPGDITVPVEIDGRGRRNELDGTTSPTGIREEEEREREKKVPGSSFYPVELP